MKRLIVNADDFGLSLSINRGIVVAHRDGILTSVSLLANGLAFDDAIDSSRRFPQLSVGVHLNLSQGPSVSPASRIPTLVNEAGELYLEPPRLWMGLLRRQINLEEIYEEWRAQILKVLSADVAPTHLDGHLHVHVLPQLSPVVIELAREFNIRHVRCPVENLEATLPLIWRNGGAAASLERSAIAYGVTSFARQFKARLLMAGLTCPDAFLGLAHTGFWDTNGLSALLALVSNGITELMCHPGYDSPETDSLGGALTRQREAEVLALISPETRGIVGRSGIRLINFRDWLDDCAH